LQFTSSRNINEVDTVTKSCERAPIRMAAFSLACGNHASLEIGKADQRQGFSLVELLVVIGIISVLVGFSLPAIHSIRESARSVECKNNLRQIALATLDYEGTRRRLPGPWFNAPMDTPDYRCDRGLFIQLLPFIEQSSLSYQMTSAPTTFDLTNANELSAQLSLLHCPSADAPRALTDMARLFSSPSLPGLNSVTCDYIGNGGYFPAGAGSDRIPNPNHVDGPIGVQIDGTAASAIRLAQVSDGLSNTFLYWESLGAKRILPNGLELDVDQTAVQSFVLFVQPFSRIVYVSTGQPSTKSYFHSWAGLRIGTVYAHGGKVVNRSNESGDPFSRHPAGCNAVRVDGSVHFVSDAINPEVMFSLVSAAGGP